jgi:NADH/NAD ratio-sensing transcriptional regulator Rex
MSRIKILFKINNEVIVEENRPLTIKQIEDMKFNIAEECEVAVFEVNHEMVEVIHELSEDIDVGVEGLYFFNAAYPEPIVGITCQIDMFSDAFLDAVLDGTIDKYLFFNI